MSEPVLLEVDGGIATVTLNRPDKRNAMNRAMLDGLRRCFDDLETRGDVRVVVVRGAGPAFCAGMDLREMEAQPGADGDPESGVTQVLQRIERSRHPTIAVLHGDALAGGCELALHCDLRIAPDGARPAGAARARTPARVGWPCSRSAGPGSAASDAGPRRRLTTSGHVRYNAHDDTPARQALPEVTMLTEFTQFLRKTNALALAVAV